MFFIKARSKVGGCLRFLMLLHVIENQEEVIDARSEMMITPDRQVFVASIDRADDARSGFCSRTVKADPVARSR